ncbi:MAG: hypothetical protein LBM17_07800 [Candidatus Accumulibacter sp.]|jgi:hypothetical protein|nr:hypothetical protein [Accumulibacter sp.]
MNTEAGSKEWKRARRGKIVFAVAMVCLLAVSTPFYFYARHRLERSRADGVFAARVFQEAQRMEANVLGNERFNALARELQAAASKKGLSPAHWAERRVNLRQGNLSRDEMNELLFSIARTESRFFHVEEFDVSVTRDEGGLFSPPLRVNSPMSATVKGTLVFLARSGPQ